MTGFRQLGYDATLQQVLEQRRNDAAVVDNLLQYKYQGRDRTGLRANPSADDDVIAGDVKGDVVYDFSGNYRYELVSNNGTLQWVRVAIVTSF